MDDGERLAGCLLDVTLQVMLFPEMQFSEYVAKYEDDMDPAFKLRVDKARALYVRKLEHKPKNDFQLESSADVVWEDSYGRLLSTWQ